LLKTQRIDVMEWKRWSRVAFAQGRCATRLRYAPTLNSLILNHLQNLEPTLLLSCPKTTKSDRLYQNAGPAPTHTLSNEFNTPTALFGYALQELDLQRFRVVNLPEGGCSVRRRTRLFVLRSRKTIADGASETRPRWSGRSGRDARGDT
jgi:hypothetical protein